MKFFLSSIYMYSGTGIQSPAGSSNSSLYGFHLLETHPFLFTSWNRYMYFSTTSLILGSSIFSKHLSSSFNIASYSSIVDVSCNNSALGLPSPHGNFFTSGSPSPYTITILSSLFEVMMLPT
eukprot:TRINITY_DN12857_c0_g1_i2.p2 TRINITY_DN12857_c0_g1~~TRINITY_DN12857_c0_g1_i2.p2  ORF type:complete len:122 (+),score=15.42 TRINITY_DN12857_c0_g1_i2:12-377(+)